MSAHGTLTGINHASLREAFGGSEDILAQMLGLFVPQCRERMVHLEAALAAWDVMAARRCLHSLVNISGAVHAYGMSEQAGALGEAVKRDDPVMSEQLLAALKREAGLVLRQASALADALAASPSSVWAITPPD